MKIINEMTTHAEAAASDCFEAIFEVLFIESVRPIMLPISFFSSSVKFSSFAYTFNLRYLQKDRSHRGLYLTEQLTSNRLKIKHFGNFSASKVSSLWHGALSCCNQSSSKFIYLPTNAKRTSIPYTIDCNLISDLFSKKKTLSSQTKNHTSL